MMLFTMMLIGVAPMRTNPAANNRPPGAGALNNVMAPGIQSLAVVFIHGAGTLGTGSL